MSVNLKPAGPCPKCGGKVWEGPRYQSQAINIRWAADNTEPRHIPDYLAYACTECRYVQKVAPLDRQSLTVEEIVKLQRRKRYVEKP